jgi:shikimate dehydrogenase
MAVSQEVISVALVGAGVGESFSPALHEREAARLGLPYSYATIDLEHTGQPPEAVREIVEDAASRGLRGMNVTHPCKQLVVPELDSLSPQADALGAVNTVLFIGSSTGHNTDWPAFEASFRRGLPGASTRHVVLVGAGGAGAAVAHALRSLGAERITVIDTDPERADVLAEAVGAEVGDDIERALHDADGLVHATPTGMAAHPGSAVPKELLDPRFWVAEVVYRPLETQLLRDARAAGCRTLDGGGMAVFQAVWAFELFTGIEPDADRMLADFADLAREADG